MGVSVCSVHLVFVSIIPQCINFTSVRVAEKTARGLMEFRHLRPKEPMAGVEFLGRGPRLTSKGVWGAL